MKGVNITLQVKPEVKLKTCAVPYILKQKVSEELDKLEHQGVISPVKTAQWAAPIVPVVKHNGSIRICGDFKTTFNQASVIESYPLPRIEEIFANLAGGKYFSKLDLASAYLQLTIAKESREFLTVNTPKGLYQYNRLPFGITSAPAIFQHRDTSTWIRRSFRLHRRYPCHWSNHSGSH